MSRKNNEWLKDYEDFINGESSSVPKDVSDRVYSKIENLINPRAVIVFLKILGVHLMTGFLSLSVCHQFGMNPFNTERSLDSWFMATVGHNACMLICGTLFVSISLLAAGYFLTIEEIKALKRTGFLQTLSLGLISLGLFAVFGAELVLSIAGLWLLGGLIGGFVATEAIWQVKKTANV